MKTRFLIVAILCVGTNLSCSGDENDNWTKLAKGNIHSMSTRSKSDRCRHQFREKRTIMRQLREHFNLDIILCLDKWHEWYKVHHYPIITVVPRSEW